MDFAIRLVNSVLYLPNRQVKIFEEFKWHKNCVINPAYQNDFGASWNEFWASACQLQLARMATCKTDFLCTLDVALFTTYIKSVFQQIRLLTGLTVVAKMRGITFQLILLHCCKTSALFVACSTQSFNSRLSLIVWVNVVLNRTVVVDGDWRFDNLCSSHLQSQSESYHVSWWYYTLVIKASMIQSNFKTQLSCKCWRLK